MKNQPMNVPELTLFEPPCKDQKRITVLFRSGHRVQNEFTLSDLVQATGAKRRSIQIWADRGVIEPVSSTQNAGTGVHRLFSRREAIVACIIHPFAERQISIGELKSIAALLRASIRMHPDPYERAIAGEGNTIFAYEGHKKGAKLITQHTVMDQDAFAHRTTSWPDVMMAIRLETYLAKLK